MYSLIQYATIVSTIALFGGLIWKIIRLGRRINRE